MPTDETELQQLLKTGLAAAQAGNQARAQELLLQVVEQDETNEAAWLALSEVVADPTDQQTALENALALNPHNSEAQARLIRLRSETQPSAAPPEDNWRKYLPEVPLEANDNIDDPYQCPYCGRVTGEEDRNCSYCKQSLYIRGSWSTQISEFLKLTLLMVGISLALGLLGMMAPIFAITFNNPSGGNFVQEMFGIRALVGDFLKIPTTFAGTLITFHLIRAGLLAGLLFLLSQRWAVGFYAAVGLLIFDSFWNGYLLLTGYLGLLGAGLMLVIDLVTLILLFAASHDFPIHAIRLLTMPDTTARNSRDFYRRGHDYRKRGMWALAVAQWRKAIGLAPHETQYYKDLAIGYSKIKRFDRSQRTLKEALNQKPDDKGLQEILALVQAEAAKTAAPGTH